MIGWLWRCAAACLLALVGVACKCTEYDVHLLGGMSDDKEPAVMAVHVLLLEQAEKDQLVGLLLADDGLAKWFNPDDPEDSWAKMRRDARDKRHLEEITFDTAQHESVERLPMLGREGLWVCVLANPSHQITSVSDWKMFHSEQPAPPSGCDVYFGVNKRHVEALKAEEDREVWEHRYWTGVE